MSRQTAQQVAQQIAQQMDSLRVIVPLVLLWAAAPFAWANGGGASTGHGARLALPRRIDPDYIITARK